MPSVFICADCLRPSDSRETCYSFGPGPTYSPIEIDPAGNTVEGASLIPASNTRAAFAYKGELYKLLNRQHSPFGSEICKSSDSGATWAVLDSGNSPAFVSLSGCVSGSTVTCAFISSNSVAAAIHLQDFDLDAGTWGAVYGTSGAPTSEQASTVVVWKRPDASLLVLFQNRNDFSNPAGPSGIGGAAWSGTWGAPFDAGAGILALSGWDATQTLCNIGQTTSTMDPAGRVHLFFRSSSVQVSPVIWGSRCFYQAIELSNTLGSFENYPGQVAPLTGGKQDLVAFSGSPLGQPVIVGNTIVLPVLMTNRIQTFPHEIGGVYLGTPLAAPVWSLDQSKTIDPESLVDTFIYPQEAPAGAFDGVTMYFVYPAEDADDFTAQNYGRLRMATSSNVASPANGWHAVTVFDLQVDAPPGFNIAGQQLVAASVFVPVSAGRPFPFRAGAAGGPRYCPAIKNSPKRDWQSWRRAYEAEKPQAEMDYNPFVRFLRGKV